MLFINNITIIENSIKIEKDKLSSIEDSVMTDSILKLLYEFWIVNSYDPSKVDKTKLFITNKTFTSYKNNIPEVKKEVVPPKEEYKEIKIDNQNLNKVNSDSDYNPNYVIINGKPIYNEQEAIAVTEDTFNYFASNVTQTINHAESAQNVSEDVIKIIKF